MGAIQNSINKISASVAGAAVGLKHAKEEALLGKQQFHEAGAKLEENKQAQESANKAISDYKEGTSVEDAQKLVDAATSKKQKGKAMKELKAANQRFTAAEAAEYSLAILAEEEKAYLAMQERAATKMRWGGVR